MESPSCLSLADILYQLPHQKLLYTQCIYGCDSNLVNVSIGGNKSPTCEAIPVGVWPSPIVTTIEMVDLEERYYLISSESSIVLECYPDDYYMGGTGASNDYCETGYTGPCRSQDASYNSPR